MASILTFLKQNTFGPEMTQVMGEAYDRATKALIDTSPVVQEVIANRIIQLAGSGECDPQKLADMALRTAGIPS